MYQLTRKLPDGTEKKHSPTDTKREAANAAGMCLYDNRLDTRRGAQVFSKLMERSPLGLALTHHSGYRFWITEV